MGISQPLLISIMSRASGKAANRLAVLITPMVMGVVAEPFGIEASFYVVGGTLVVVLLWLSFRARAALGERA